MGVHTLGRALPENSGFDGFCVSHWHARTFSNQFYINMIAVGWDRKQVASGKWQWVRAADRLPGEMMLNTDMCLTYQAGFRVPFTQAEDGNFAAVKNLIKKAMSRKRRLIGFRETFVNFWGFGCRFLVAF